MGATQINVFDEETWAQRLVRLFPRSWTSDDAKQPGGKLFSIFESQGAELSFLQENLEYDLLTCRLATAIDEGLDRVVADFFDPELGPAGDIRRAPGEPDESFRQRAQAALFQGGGTRPAMANILKRVTGEAPRIIEPWYIGDTACLDSISYCDIDTPENPSRIYDGAMRYQGMVETVLPGFGGQGNFPIYGLDEGLAVDISFCIDPVASWFIQSGSLDQVINKAKIFGTTVWRKFFQQAFADYARGSTNFFNGGETKKDVTLFPATAGPYSVVAQPSWNTGVQIETISASEFIMHFDVPAPVGGSVDWVCAPVTVPGFNTLTVAEEIPNVDIAVPDTGAAGKLFATPSWNTSVFLTADEDSVAHLEFGVPAPFPIGEINYGFFQNFGQESVGSGDFAKTIDLPSGTNPPYQVFILPEWNTRCFVTKTFSNFTVEFSDDPDGDSSFYWAVSEF